jgi:hypothetical protein
MLNRLYNPWQITNSGEREAERLCLKKPDNNGFEIQGAGMGYGFSGYLILYRSKDNASAIYWGFEGKGEGLFTVVKEIKSSFNKCSLVLVNLITFVAY